MNNPSLLESTSSYSVISYTLSKKVRKNSVLTLKRVMSQNGQKHLKNLAAFCTLKICKIFLKCLTILGYYIFKGQNKFSEMIFQRWFKLNLDFHEITSFFKIIISLNIFVVRPSLESVPLMTEERNGV